MGFFFPKSCTNTIHKNVFVLLGKPLKKVAWMFYYNVNEASTPEFLSEEHDLSHIGLKASKLKNNNGVNTR